VQGLRRSEVEDGALIELCRQGDARAWRTLLARHERLVFSIPLSFGLTRDDAAEVTQATFAELVRSLDSLREPDRVQAWLGTVARRQTFRIIEHRRRLRETAAEHLDVLSDETIEHRLADVEWVTQGLARIPERCRSLLQALYFSGEEPSYVEVAATLGVPVGSIGPTRGRCLAALKAALDDLQAT
jgi:RNA polymerase sigma factor (sigma-70 family)